LTIYLHPSITSGARAAGPNIQSGALPKKMADLEEKLKQLNPARRAMTATKKVKCQGATSVSTRVTTKFSEKTMWITVDELAGPSHLNSKAHAEIAIAHLMTRAHENVALAAAGIKQYQWTVKATWHTSIEEATTAQSSRSET
jgi:hypothetical protein